MLWNEDGVNLLCHYWCQASYSLCIWILCSMIVKLSQFKKGNRDLKLARCVCQYITIGHHQKSMKTFLKSMKTSNNQKSMKTNKDWCTCLARLDPNFPFKILYYHLFLVPTLWEAYMQYLLKGWSISLICSSEIFFVLL